MSATAKHAWDVEVLIIGAGFGGLGMAIQLQKAGINSFLIVEKAADVGGVWRDNVYPGAACDVPSHLYSFSFFPRSGWSNSYSPQQEILDYIRDMVSAHGLQPHLRLQTEVRQLLFDDELGIWKVGLATGDEIRARVVVNAMGALNIPSLPDIQGLKSFKGKILHTAMWDQSVDLAGKNVAVVGTGASAIQVIPALQKSVKTMTVLQRSPAWVLPKPLRRFKSWEKSLFGRFPGWQRFYRRYIYAINEMAFPVFLWNSPITRLAEMFAKSYIRRSIKDPELRDKLTPRYSLGCKRVLLSNDYYRALSKKNVHVVCEALTEIDASGLITEDGRHRDVDAIIFATGFHVPSHGAPFPIRGLGGRQLADDWSQGCEAYKGTTISGYPNLLFIMGPNTGPGHTSVLYYMESQFAYIRQYIESLHKAGDDKFFDVKAARQQQFNARLQQRMAKTVWQSGCSSWYLAPNGKNTTLWPGFSWQYRLSTRHFRPGDYTVYQAGPDTTAAIEPTDSALATG